MRFPNFWLRLIVLHERCFWLEGIVCRRFRWELEALRRDDRDVLWSAGGIIDLAAQQITMRGFDAADNGTFDNDSQVDYLPGCSLLIRTGALRQIGPLPEEYFLYFEETDWCMRARRLGWDLLFVPQSRVWHLFEQAKLQEPVRVYYYNRNELLFWSRWGRVNGKCILKP